MENAGLNCDRDLRVASSVPMIARHRVPMSRRRNHENQNLLFFPDEADPCLGPERNEDSGSADSKEILWHASTVTQSSRRVGASYEVVISGSYRKDLEALKRTYEEFRDLGCEILSPSSVAVVSEHDGFVYMKGEEAETPDKIENRHLLAIQKANFVWLHAPEGYVGPTSALEVGFANAAGVPVYAKESPKDKVLQAFVQVVPSPAELLKSEVYAAPPAPALKAFQEYYRRAAIQRGYSNEGPKECLLLMMEEVGELARALRKREKIARHGAYSDSNEAHELADVFLYVVHMANVLGFDLADIVRSKETVNLKRFLAR